MLYKYIVSSPEGERSTGVIDAATMEIAIKSLQARNFIILSIIPEAQEPDFFKRALKYFQRIKFRDIVILSRQLSTLFSAKVSVLESFKLISGETENMLLREKMGELVDDIQGGLSMSQSMAKHPNIFSHFYVNMVKAGEESGKLEEIFANLADYLDRFYELTNKAKHALIYPAFVVLAFVLVLILMLVFVIPKLTGIITETGQDIPIYTKVIIGLSTFTRDYGFLILIAVIFGGFFLWRYIQTESGRDAFARFQMSVPYVGTLYKKLYVSRMADNLQMCLSSGISMVRALEITSDVVGSGVFKTILDESVKEVKAGNALSDIFAKYHDMPSVFSQMVRIGEESGKLNFILKSLADFYKKEVDNAIDTIVKLIEPAMVIVLGAGVAFLLVAILLPIYNVASSI